MLPAFLLLLCLVLRLVPHPANFAPVGASAIFAGRTLPLPLALAFTFAAMFAGDVALARLHGYDVVTGVTPFVYAGFAVQSLLGRALRAKRGGAVAASLLGSTSFFVLSNLGVWAVSGIYPADSTGLGACFVAALPFFAATVAGDLVFTLLLAAVFRFAARPSATRFWVPVPPTAMQVL